MKIDKEKGLKPCPFCGSIAVLLHNDAGASRVRCVHVVGCRIHQDWWDDKEDAIAAWNHRYDSDEDDGR